MEILVTNQANLSGVTAPVEVVQPVVLTTGVAKVVSAGAVQVIPLVLVNRQVAIDTIQVGRV